MSNKQPQKPRAVYPSATSCRYFTVNPVNFLEDITADPSRMETIMPFYTIGDFENYLQRLNKLPRQVRMSIQKNQSAMEQPLAD